MSLIAHDVEDGVTELRFDKQFAVPGQYCFVNIPALSLYEWHPFSLSSSPLDGFAQMCIKSMGPGSFTGNLHDLAKSNPALPSLVVNVDGPYGQCWDPFQCSAICLIAGGIGITPMHSTYRMLAQLESRHEFPESLQLVRLVWIGRSMGLFRVLMQSLVECTHSEKFQVVLHVTDEAEAAEAGQFSAEQFGVAAQAVQLLTGRPSFDVLFESLVRDYRDHGPILVKACGPDPMILAAQKAALSWKEIVYESDSFAL
jgi:NADPH oxidase